MVLRLNLSKIGWDEISQFRQMVGEIAQQGDEERGQGHIMKD